MLRLTLIRHASTAWNEERRYQGWADPPLSDRGRREARRLAARLASARFGRIVASGAARCAETLALALPGAAPETDAGWRELGFGAWDGRTYDENVAEGGDRFLRWVADPGAETPPGGEAFGAFAARVDAAMDALPAEGEALVVSHGGPIRRAVARALGCSWAQAMLLEVSACGITRLALHPDGAHLLCLNDTAHLEG